MVRDEVLIVMAKPPEKGLVKTRLAAELGDRVALSIYVELLKHTFEVVQKSGLDTVVFFSKPSDFTKEFEMFHHQYQQGNNLGERMGYAFDWAFNQGYESAIMVGTDCPDLDVDVLQQSCELLDEVDLVIGPAEDGGYYLIAMNGANGELLVNIPWSSDEVLSETTKKADNLKISYRLLKTLNDIDTAEDWNLSSWKKKKGRNA